MSTSENFFFISYNQKDGDKIVYKDEEYFKKHFFNCWIDKDGMRATDNTWIERARATIFNENCKGAVFYLSENSLKSDAVEEEIKIVTERIAQDSSFFAFAVVVNAGSVLELIKNIYTCTDNSQLVKVLPINRIATIAKIFTDEKIYIVRNDNNLETYYQSLEKNLRDYGVILDKQKAIQDMQASGIIDAHSTISFGRFYQENTILNKLVSCKNVFEKIDDDYYIELDDGIHKGVDIKWIILDYDASNKKMTLISEKSITNIRGRDIDEWLNGQFANIAFTEEERSKIDGRIKTLSYEDYNRYASREGLNLNPYADRYWLSSRNERGEVNMLMYVNEGEVKKMGLNKTKECGIRPIIIMEKA